MRLTGCVAGWRVGLAFVPCVLGVLLCGCGEGGSPAREPAREAGPVRVVVSVAPLSGLVSALLPDDVEVRVLVPAGGSPHGYEPTPGDIAAVGRADLVVLVGMGIESGLPASVREGPRVLSMGGVLGLDTGAGAHDHNHHDHGHDHGHDHDHAHAGEDPHLWLDPVLVESFLPKLADGVVTALERAGGDASVAGPVGARLARLLTDVREVDAAYREALSAHEGAVVITQHAAWSRLTDRYGLVVASEIQAAEDSGPSSGRLAELVTTARELGVRAILTEPQLNRSVAERLGAQLGVPVGTIDPLGSGDWSGMMLGNLSEIVSVLEGTGDGG